MFIASADISVALSQHSVILAGLVAGLLHVVMGVDHLAALMPLSHGKSLKAAWLGFRWGIGHTIGVMIVAIAILILRDSVSGEFFETIGTWGERLVGAMLIGFGIWGVRIAIKGNLHTHDHGHADDEHSHLHLHIKGHDQDKVQPHMHTHAALGAGALHGIAGMSHLFGVMPALALGKDLAGVYLLSYAVGSVVCMTLFAGGFGGLTKYAGDRVAGLVKGGMITASSVCILIGIGWIALPLMGFELP
ncbi:MAG: hydantoin utilization protein A [Planctomycetes bacterium]|nr:hydantoin utilization protein A [Planctomycetota bacterium]